MRFLQLATFYQNSKNCQRHNTELFKPCPAAFTARGFGVQKVNNQKKIMAQVTFFLNPFSADLGKEPVQQKACSLVYENGDYRIYRYLPDYHIYCFKNIVIAERVGLDRSIIDGIVNNVQPLAIADKSINYERPLQAKRDGIALAKKLNFSIV